MMKGDDYFVKEISLLYTEFKKMEGHIVQAPNSYLNTLFILNMRRSGGLAEAVPLTVKFGTTLDQIDDFRQRLLEFVKLEKREYQPNILTVRIPFPGALPPGSSFIVPFPPVHSPNPPIGTNNHQHLLTRS